MEEEKKEQESYSQQSLQEIPQQQTTVSSLDSNASTTAQFSAQQSVHLQQAQSSPNQQAPNQQQLLPQQQISAAELELFFMNYSHIENYRIIEHFDTGGTAYVHLANRQQDPEAVQIIKIYKETDTSNDNFAREVKSLNYIKQRGGHPNIVNLIESFPNIPYYSSPPDPVSRNVQAIVLEYCKNGSLFEYVKCSRYLPPEIARTLFIQAAQALEFIHSIGLAHRDIKVENMLLTEDFTLKIADFGFTEDINKYEDGLLRTILGSESYMSPELIQQQNPYNGHAVDIFALGASLFFMVTGNRPFKTADSSQDPHYRHMQNRADNYWKTYTNYLSRQIQEKLQIAKAEAENQASQTINTEFKSLLQRMLAENVNTRPSAAELLHDAWLQGPRASQKQVEYFFNKVREAVQLDRQEQVQQTTQTATNTQMGNGPDYRSGRFRSLVDGKEDDILLNIAKTLKFNPGDSQRTLRQENVQTPYSYHVSGTSVEILAARVYVSFDFAQVQQLRGSEEPVDELSKLTLQIEKISESYYKFYVNVLRDGQTLTKINIEILRSVDKNNLVVRYLRKEGELEDFHEAAVQLMARLKTT